MRMLVYLLVVFYKSQYYGMYYPKEGWKHIYKITNHLASIKLPPATTDFKEGAGKASVTHKVQ